MMQTKALPLRIMTIVLLIVFGRHDFYIRTCGERIWTALPPRREMSIHYRSS